MSKYVFLPLALLFALMLTLPATPAFSAETVDVIMHVENQSKKMASIAISPWSYTSWDEDIVLKAGKKIDLKHTENLTAGGSGIVYQLFVSRFSGDKTCLFSYRFDHNASGNLVLSEPEFTECLFDSSITHTTYRDGNKMYVTILIK